MTLIERLGVGNGRPVLDIGAGLGRNALYLAGRGFAVDAVEATEQFVERLAAEAAKRALTIRVISRNIFECSEELCGSYQLILLSGVAGDFRELEQMRQIFELAAQRLVPAGLLLLNVHIAARGYVPDQASRQWSQQCCAMFFTRSELSQAMAGLPLELLSDESAYDYEQQHLPEGAWPPTVAYGEWALGQHMFALERDDCPLELRWLVIAKKGN